MSSIHSRGEASPGSSEFLDENEVDQALYAVSGARNIAMLCVLGVSDGFTSSYELQQHYSSASQAELSRNLAGGQLKNQPEDILTKAYLDATTPPQYALTDIALQRYRPLAGHVCQISRRYDIAPTDLVGFRSKARTDEGLSAPFARLHIYGRLLERHKNQQTDPITIIAFAEAMELNARVMHNHLSALERSGIIELTSDGSRKQYPEYAHSEDAPEADLTHTHWNKKTKALAVEILSMAKAGAIINVTTVRDSLVQNETLTHFTSSQQKHKQMQMINQVCEELQRQGVFAIEREPKVRATHLALTDRGLNIVKDYLTSFIGVVAGDADTLASGTRTADAYALQPDNLDWLLQVDFENGAITERDAVQKKGGAILRMLQSTGELSTNDVIERLGLKRQATHAILTDMRRRGEIVGKMHGRSMLWTLPEKTNPPTA